MKPHELLDKPCRCLHCKLNARAIMLDVAYRLNREFTPETGDKLARRIKGEWDNYQNN